jgi:hypothetical protein
MEGRGDVSQRRNRGNWRSHMQWWSDVKTAGAAEEKLGRDQPLMTGEGVQ